MTKTNTINGLTEMKKVADNLQYSANEWSRFDSKQAWWSDIIATDEADYRLLKSYNTIVVLVDVTNRKFYELGKYSATTSKQVTQFYNKFYSSFEGFLVVY